MYKAFYWVVVAMLGIAGYVMNYASYARGVMDQKKNNPEEEEAWWHSIVTVAVGVFVMLLVGGIIGHTAG